MKYPDISIVIVTYNCEEFLEACIDSLIRSKGMHFRITIVDNASTDGTVQLIEQKYQFVRLLRNTENMGYAQAVNKGIKSINEDFVIIANADVVFDRDAVHTLIGYLSRNSETGVVGPQQVFPDGRWQRSYGNMIGVGGSIKNAIGITSFHNWTRRLAWPRRVDAHPKQVGYIDGAVMAIRKNAYDSVGGFDEDFFLYGEEADFCFRLKKAGWNVVFLPSAQIIHMRGGSSSKVERLTDKYSKLQVDSKLLFVRKHCSRRQVQPYIVIEMIHAKKMVFIYKIIRQFAPKNKREYLLNMALLFNCLAQIWRNSYE